MADSMRRITYVMATFVAVMLCIIITANPVYADTPTYNEINVTYGDAVNLTVEIEEEGDYQYSWSTGYYDGEGWKKESLDQYTASNIELSNIQRTQYYYCYVKNGNEYVGTYTFYVIVENGFDVSADNNRVTVESGGNAALEVNAKAVSGELHYQWSKVSYNADLGWWTTSTVIQGANDKTLMVEDITEMSRYDCSVTDDYGNWINIDFYISIENGFSADTEQSAFKINPGESVDLTVNAKADNGSLSYIWYVETCDSVTDDSSMHEIEDFNGKESVTLKNVVKTSRHLCRVSDEFGNSKDVWFHISVENGLTATPEQSAFTVEPGSSVQLQVNAAANDGDLTYLWYERTYDPVTGYETNGSELAAFNGKNTADISNITSSGTYYCVVGDKYGNTSYVWFTVSIENGFSAEAEQSSYNLKTASCIL